MTEIPSACQESPKQSLRGEVRGRLAQLSAERSGADACIIRHLSELLARIYTAGDPRKSSGEGFTGLAAYMAIGKEPVLLPLLRERLSAGCPLYLPRYSSATKTYEMVNIRSLSADMAEGRYHIPEPVPTLPGVLPPYKAPLNWVWLVPAIAFDSRGHRLGRGGGFYDRLLDGADGVKIGVAYDCQLVDAIPSECHDQVMDYVVTESHLISC